MSKLHKSSKTLFCTTPQARQVPSKLTEKLSELNSIKSDLIKQKDLVNSLKPFSFSSDSSPNELKVALKLEKEQNESLKNILLKEREKFRGTEKEMESCKQALRDLEHKNRHAELCLVEKDRMLSRYVCEMLILKQEVEKLINPSSPICKSLQNSLKVFNTNEPKYEPLKLEVEEINTFPGKSQKYYESEINRLQKQLSETQDLYKITNHQLKDLIDKTAKQDSEYLALQQKLNSMKLDFSETSSSILRNSAEKEFVTKKILVELEELRKKRDEQDLENNRIEKRYKNSLNELKDDLSRSRERILEIIEAKSLQEKELSALKAENKEICKDLHFKDLKISDLSAQIASLNQELKFFKNISKNKPVDSMDVKVRQKFEGKIQELLQKNENLTVKLQQFEQEKQKNSSETSSQSKTIVNQLTNIILSRDKQGNNDRKDSIRNLSRFLIENHEVFQGILDDYFGKSYETLREMMQEKLEEMIVINEELQKENFLISEKLKLESAKRLEIFNQLHELEKDVRRKEEKNSDSGFLRQVLDIENDEECFINASDLICFMKCQAALIETGLEVED
jgi:Fe-S-cluster formation regulator IscX/YfhJ